MAVLPARPPARPWSFDDAIQRVTKPRQSAPKRLPVVVRALDIERASSRLAAPPTRLPQTIDLLSDLKTLLRVALQINDRLRIDVDHAVFDGSTNDVDDLRAVVNRLSWKYEKVTT